MDLDQLLDEADPTLGVVFEVPAVETIIGKQTSPSRQSAVLAYRSRRAAWAWLGIVAVLVVALVVGLRLSSSPKSNGVSSAGKVAVDVNATPRGWVPVDYGDAQVSVPSNWVFPVDGGCPSPKQGHVFLFGPDGDQVSCGSEASLGDSVYFASSSMKGTGNAIVVNGINVYFYEGGSRSTEVAGSTWLVPSLGVVLILTGPLGNRVLNTLTYSPRAVALASGAPPAIPSFWHRVAFGGVSVEVPEGWSQFEQSGLGTCGSGITFPSEYDNAVVLDPGTSVDKVRCSPPLPQPTPVSSLQPSDGIVIDPGRFGPLQDAPATGPCLPINGLSVCPMASDYYGTLLLAVDVPGKSHPFAVQIGLGGNGMVARTILYSMRPG